MLWSEIAIGLFGHVAIDNGCKKIQNTVLVTIMVRGVISQDPANVAIVSPITVRSS